ncbi:putative histone-lysine N-methyltransferase 1 [Achroia grisella]|uniref:putative histone-lysine N-methyltransferase 1 n=1 Tax=Achroia grisella TaxID=688607 RepID=UPI0027D1F669|nr:putative histone-lysine N-methyltransferase 1 [Achroia grisella]
MDIKDSRSESTLGDRINDGIKFPANSSVPSCNRNKPYQDVTSNQLGKMDVPTRPCAVIGPDRVLPPLISNDLKKGAYESWSYAENPYQYPPDYPHKTSNYQTPLRNISPRQTFQENMQRIMVPPSYHTGRINEDPSLIQKNMKSNIPAETKYCDVPYTINNLNNDQNSVRNTEIRASNVNPVLAQTAPNGWPPIVRTGKPYSGPELYQYPDYASCAGPRPVQINRQHRTTHEDPGLVYADLYGCDGNKRYQPYPAIKERYPQTRYEYIGNYSNPFHPMPPFPPNKYDLQKSLPSPYNPYPQIPLKYFDGRISEPIVDGYQRSNPQGNYNFPIRNQVTHPTYGPMLGNYVPNKIYPLPPESSVKSISANKLSYDNSKVYVDYVDNSRSKPFVPPENFYVNEISKPHHTKNQCMPNYPTVNMHALPHPYYRKENTTFKNYEYNMTHYRNMDSSMSLSRNMSQISPHTIAISPSDSNTSNDTMQTHLNSQEDCGYVSQSPTTSIRSMDLGINRMSSDFYRRYDPRFLPTTRPTMMSKPELNAPGGSKEKKGIDVRQFLQMWNEGDDENNENCSKEITVPSHTNAANKITVHKDLAKNQDQLYVLGLVNVPNEDLSKYDHIQKVSKLPENIKGYNSIELLNQFEEAIESSKKNNYTMKHPSQRDIRYPMPIKGTASHQTTGLTTRSVSPLDVEAKISQSVIHKEVGCNFEIKPCSPQMLNVEVATPAQTVLGERVIEKVTNPLILTQHRIHTVDDINKNVDLNHKGVKSLSHLTSNEDLKIPSCKMANTQFAANDIVESGKNNYSLQDLESNSSISLASLPRLDNDIELNFTEVNQQFINANKVETVITTTKDLTSISNNSENILKHTTNNFQSESEISCQFVKSPSIESEREFSKLSKYRKIKKGSELNVNNMQPCLQTLRTDSVIIKNPDNSKINDNNKDTLCPVNKLTENLQIYPVNLSPSCRSPLNKVNSISDERLGVEDIAIDFSISKSKNICPTSTSPPDKDLMTEKLMNPAVNSLHPVDLCTQYDTDSFTNDQSENVDIKQENYLKDSHKDNKDRSNRVTSLTENDHLNLPALPNEFVCEHNSTEDVSGALKVVTEDYMHDKQSLNIRTSTNQTSNYTNLEDKSKSNTKLNVDDLLNINETVLGTDSNVKSVSDKQNISELMSAYRQNTVATEDQKGITDNAKKNISKLNVDISKLDVEIACETSINIDRIQINRTTDDNSESSILMVNEKVDPNNMLSEIIDISLKTNTEGKSSNTAHNASIVQDIPKDTDTNNSTCRDIVAIEKTINKSHISIVEDNAEDIDSNTITSKTADFCMIKCTEEIESKNETNIHDTDMVPILQTNDNPSSFTNIISSTHEKEIHDVDLKNLICNDQKYSLISNNVEISTDPSKNNSQDQNIQHVLSKQLLCKRNDTVIELNNTNTNDEYQSDSTDKVLETICVDTTELQNQRLEMKPTNLYDVLLSPHQDEAEVNGPSVHNKLNNHNTCSKINTTNVDSIKSQIKIPNIITNEISSECFVSEISSSNSTTFATSNFSLDSNVKIIVNDKNIIPEAKLIETNEDIFIHNEKTDNTNYRNVENNSLCHSITDSDMAKSLDLSSTTDIKKIPYRIRKELFSPWIQKLMMCENIVYNTLSSQTCFTIKTNFDTNNTTSNSMEYENKNFEIVSNSNIQDISIIKEIVTDNQEEGNNSANNEEMFSVLQVNDSSNKFKNLETTALLSNTVSKQNSELCEQSIESPKLTCIIATENIINIEDYVHTNSTCTDIIKNTTVLPKELYKEHGGNVDKNFVNVIEYSVESENLGTSEKTCLKRAFSDSALDRFKDDSNDDFKLNWQSKRRKNNLHNLIEQPLLDDNFCSIQNIRRNSISSIYNEENVSICILIDNNCIITEENEEEKLCLTEISEDTGDMTNKDYEITCSPSKIEVYSEDNKYRLSECVENIDESFEEQEPWVEDVACVETVVSDDVVEDITVSNTSSPRQINSSEDEDTEIFIGNQHRDKVKYIYGDKMCNDDAQFVETLYRTPQMDVNKTLINRECHMIEEFEKCFNNDSLENILTGSNQEDYKLNSPDLLTTLSVNVKSISDIESVSSASVITDNVEFNNDFKDESERIIQSNVLNIQMQDDTIHSCESSIDNVFNYNKKEDFTTYNTSSSPEVSSTTSEEKSSTMLLKITTLKVSKRSQYSDDESETNNKQINPKHIKDSLHCSSGNYNVPPSRPLITKAAQKYIPPLKETFQDLKIKLPLPQHSLLKLRQLKILKTEPKTNKHNNNLKKEIPKKHKPKFEEVLKSIDEIQFKMLKEKSKKVKKTVPKVVIKKNENGSHYASTPKTRSTFNPDLTGRKWQPWVFLEKNNFIDKMAIKRKSKAVFSHRKNTYVFAEKFQKYKSIESAKFVISPPKLEDSSSGQLKCTIRLKQTY